MMSRLKLKPAGAVKLIICATSVFTLGIAVVLFLDCPQIQFAGQVDPITGRLSVHDSCNSHCACATDRKAYSPVCGSDNLSYFSSCFAGCTELTNGTYTGCQCISDSTPTSSRLLAGDGTDADDILLAAGSAKPGYCLPYCGLIVPYAVAMFIASLIGSFARVPSTIVNFRVVDDDERSFALAVNSFVVNLAGFIPSPLLFGALIDSSCRLWQQQPAALSAPCGPLSTVALPSSSGSGARSGSCLLFDTTKFRQRTYGVALGVELVEITLVILLYMLIRNRQFQFNSDDDDQSGANGKDNRLKELEAGKSPAVKLEMVTNL